MPEVQVTVGSRVGLHARPAALFVRAVASQPIPVTIAKGDGKPVPAASLLSVLGLAVLHGDAVTLQAEGEGAQELLAELADMLAQELD